ncbi:hypothetical protein UQW22_07795 [Isoptericola halotolerans]|uniref:hypothetical protein n=1 Tax=Isoptericola halotolerans TaxID=300560 RepID=UPI0038903237
MSSRAWKGQDRVTNSERSSTAAVALGLKALVPVIVVVAYLVVVGYLNLHAKTIVTGAALDWSASVVAIAPPAPPLGSAVGVAIVSALAFFLAWRAHTSATRRRHQLPIWMATVALIALSTYAMVSADFPYSALASTFDNRVGLMEGASPEPLPLAFVREGALSPAAHALAGVMVVLSLLRPKQPACSTGA